MYFSGSAGATFLADSNNTQKGGTVRIDYDIGLNVGAAIGYDFGSIRAEAEVAYHYSHLQEASSGGVSVGADGAVSALSFMANGYYDFNFVNPSWVPYLGAGMGFANIDWDSDVAVGPFVDSSDIVFAYQLMAGVGFNISPSTTVTMGYRYFATSDPNFDDIFDVPYDSEYESHEVNLGVRVMF